MLYLTDTILDKAESQDIISKIMASDQWIDGNSTATYIDKNIKKNLQLSGKHLPLETDSIKEKIMNNANIKGFFFPRHIHNVLFAKTGIGMYYRPHTDIPVIKSGRRDLSFTLFLEDKNTFSGGELILNIPPEAKSVKLSQGQAIVYPTEYIHEVKPVTSGERVVCVGWIESEIPERRDREILSSINASLDHINDPTARLNANNAYNILYKRFSR